MWAHWVWCKYGVDFIKQDGEWRIWHFRCYEVARAPFNRDWISFAKDNQESHDSQLAWFGDDGVPVFLPPVDEPITTTDYYPYANDRAQVLEPEPADAVRRRSRTRSGKAGRTPLPAAAPVEAPPRRPGVVLAVACAAQFVCVLDTSIVNVALPPMQDSLGLSATGLQWVVSSYTLTFAGFLLLGGRVGDLFGRKRTFVGRPACCSPWPAWRPGWRRRAGRWSRRASSRAWAAPCWCPTTLSLITTGFPEPRAKAKALSLLTAAAAAGGRARRRDRRAAHRPAQLALGVLRQRAAGRVLLLVAAVWALPGRPPGHVRGKLDLPGSVVGHRRHRGPRRGGDPGGGARLGVGGDARLPRPRRRRRSRCSSSSSGGPSSPSSRWRSSGSGPVTVANGLGALVGGAAADDDVLPRRCTCSACSAWIRSRPAWR